MKKYIFTALAVCSLVALAVGQEAEEIPQPQKPYVAQPKLGTQWTVSWEYESKEERENKEEEVDPNDPNAASKPAAPQIKRPEQLTIKYTESVTQIIIDWSKGRDSEVFMLENKTYYISPEDGRAYQGYGDLGTLDETTGLMINGYHGVQWIDGGGTYLGGEEIDGIECYVFEMEAQQAKFDAEDPNAPPVMDSTPYTKAWIDMQTKEPVMIQLNNMTLTYGPITRVTTIPQLPKKITKLINKEKERRKALELLKKNSK